MWGSADVDALQSQGVGMWPLTKLRGGGNLPPGSTPLAIYVGAVHLNRESVNT